MGEPGQRMGQRCLKAGGIKAAWQNMDRIHLQAIVNVSTCSSSCPDRRKQGAWESLKTHRELHDQVVPVDELEGRVRIQGGRCLRLNEESLLVRRRRQGLLCHCLLSLFCDLGGILATCGRREGASAGGGKGAGRCKVSGVDCGGQKRCMAREREDGPCEAQRGCRAREDARRVRMWVGHSLQVSRLALKMLTRHENASSGRSPRDIYCLHTFSCFSSSLLSFTETPDPSRSRTDSLDPYLACFERPRRRRTMQA
ncbi:hypothetical protein FA95DRAFT_412295 [Auriscalpium vulgare]|uniref:Uncharacterized protein n=1 Tax=Auriscalpium vulgare TaxID=40419 RepID=A0ACB8RH78_9AGAM|nr:hypothetical protein FA95DRAFT_412295 [Auriscalpium vulgare]